MAPKYVFYMLLNENDCSNELLSNLQYLCSVVNKYLSDVHTAGRMVAGTLAEAGLYHHGVLTTSERRPYVPQWLLVLGVYTASFTVTVNPKLVSLFIELFAIRSFLRVSR